jgi:plastocyanin
MKTRINSSPIIILLAVMFIAVSVFTACSKSDNSTTSPGPNAVTIQSFAFTPATITVSVNTTITWTNKDAVAHTVTSTTGLFDSGLISSNGTYTHTFNTAGTFPYSCTIHPNMTATVVVQ